MPFEQYVLVPVITNQWYKIELEQAGTANENQAVFNVTINGLIVGSHQTQFAQYKKVKFYLSDPWYNSIGNQASLRNLMVTSD